MKKFFILLLTISIGQFMYSQSVGVGTTMPNASALLDISSTTKGVLIPRMTTAQRDQIVAPANGLQILNLDDHCLDMYDGTGWIKNCGFRVTGTDTAELSIAPVANFGGTARTRAVAFSIGTKGYLGTGNDGAEKKDFWEYDPATNIWTQKADLAGSARTDAVGFSISGLGYIGTGFGGGQYLSDFWQYNPATNTWTQKATVPGGTRDQAVGFSNSGNGYIGLGERNNYAITFNDMQEYSPGSNTWASKTACPMNGAYNMISFSIGNIGYVGIGYHYSSLFGHYLDNVFYSFNPAGSGTWTQLATFPGAVRHDAVGFAVGTEGYVGTGCDAAGSTRYNDLWHYNKASDTWEQLPNIGSTGRRNAVSFVIGGTAYVGTGFTGANSAEIIAFEPYPIGPVYDNMLDYAGAGGIDDGIWTKRLGVVSTDYRVDIASASRSQSHPANLPFYVTGDFGQASNGAEFRHSNGTQGIGLGFNTIYAAGSDVAQDLGFSAKGTDGDLIFNTNGLERARISGVGNLGIGLSFAHAPIQLSNTLANRKFVLYEGADNDHQFFGFGTNTGLMRYQVAATTNDHVFYAGTSTSASNELFRIKGNGNVGIGLSSPVNKLDINNGALRTGSHGTGLALYVTGTFLPAGSGVEFRHDNGTQGIGFGSTTMYAAGSNASQDLGMSAKGSSGNLIFTTNGAERMRIAGSGNIGIGTPGPDQSLSVANKFGVDANGAIHIKNTPRAMYFMEDGVANRMLLSHSPAFPAWGLQYLGTSNTFRFLADSLPVMSVYLGSNSVEMNKLGIGTPTPAYKLEVKTATNDYGISHTDGTVHIASWIGDGGEIGTVSNHTFRLFANNGVNQFELLPNGNIGMGLSGPNNKLDIAGGAVRTGTHATGRPLYVTGSLGDASNGVEIRDADGAQGVGIGRNTLYAAGSSADQNIGLAAKGVNGNVIFSANGAERIRFSPTGQIGIGTTTPHAPIMIAGASANRKIVLWETADNNHQFYGFGVNGNILRYQTDNTLSDHVFYAATSTTNSNELMRIKGNGNVTVSGVIETEAFIAPTLLNTFTNYGAPFATVGYYKDKMGIVHLRGLVTHTGDPSGLTMFTLPVGYRPSTSGQLLFSTLINDTQGRVDVKADGSVIVAFGISGWVNLNGISFRAD